MFKIGDKVRVKSGGRSQSAIKNVGCISRIKDFDTIIGACHLENINGYKEICGIWFSELELVNEEQPKTKFKVGDRYKVTKDGAVWDVIISRVSDDGIYYYGTCKEYNNERTTDSDNPWFIIAKEIDKYVFKLIESNNDIPCVSINKAKKIMNNITKFVKNSLLSAEEKLLRKHGFKTECGEYTEEAQAFAISKLCVSTEADMLKVAQGLEDEAKTK